MTYKAGRGEGFSTQGAEGKRSWAMHRKFSFAEGVRRTVAWYRTFG